MVLKIENFFYTTTPWTLLYNLFFAILLNFEFLKSSWIFIVQSFARQILCSRYRAQNSIFKTTIDLEFTRRKLNFSCECEFLKFLFKEKKKHFSTSRWC